MISRSVFLFTFIFFSVLASATSYYVSPGGNNNNPGTISKPFRNINRGISRLRPGDILYVRAGTYNETVSISGTDGTENSPVIVTAYPGEAPVIDGTGISIGAGSGLVMLWQSYIQFSGFQVRNSNQSGIVCGVNASHCLISHCQVSNVWEAGIGCYGEYGIVESCTVSDACMSNSDGIFTPPERWGAGIDVRSHSIARKNIVHDVWGEGLSITRNNSGIVEDNIIYDVCSVLLYIMNCQDCIIRRNLIYMTKTMGNVSSVGIGHWNELTTNQNAGNLIVNNIVFNCRRNFYNDSPMNGSIVAFNTFVNSTYSWNVQISGGNSVSGSFLNNIIVQEDALPCMNVQTGTNITFSHNLYNKSYDSDATGPGDITRDPGFSKAGDTGPGLLTGRYFMLSGDSPAIGKGIAIASVTDDIFGNRRDAAPDIGACEYFAEDPFIRVTEITISGAGGSKTVSTGSTLQLSTSVLPSDATEKSVSWSVTSGTEHATINSSGLLRAATTGTVTIMAKAEDGSGIFDTINISVIPAEKIFHGINIYPNPARNYFIVTIEPSFPLPLFINIINIAGTILLHDRLDAYSREFDIPESILNGIYFVQLCTDKLTYATQKLVIRK